MLTLLFPDPLSSIFVIYFFVLEEHILLALKGYLSGYRNLRWILFSFRSLRALLHWLIASCIEFEKSDAILIFNPWYEIFCFSFLESFRAFGLSVSLPFALMNLSMGLFSSAVLGAWEILLIWKFVL